MSEPTNDRLACPGVTYVSASYSSEYGFDFDAQCDGPPTCGWSVDLTDTLAPDVTEDGMRLLSEAHRDFSRKRVEG